MPAGVEKISSSIFKNRNYLFFSFSRLISLLGDSIHQIALMTLVYELTHSPKTLGNTLFFLQAPPILFGLISGILADYWHRKRIMIAADLYRTVAVAAIPFLPSIGSLYVVLVSLSGVETFYNTARVSLVPSILKNERDLISGNSFLQTITSISMILGPLIGAIIVAKMGTTRAFLIDSATFFVAALLTLPIQRSCQESNGKHPSVLAILNSIYDGYKYFVHDHKISFLIFMSGSMLGSVFLTSSLKIVFADQFISPQGFNAAQVLGYINSMNGIGCLIGGVCLPIIASHYPVEKLIIMGAILTSLDLFCFALSNNLFLILMVLVVSGCGFSWVNLSSITLIQTNARNEVRGRVLSFYSVIASIIASLSAVAGGWLAGWMGVKFVFFMSGFVCLLAATLGSFSLISPKLRYGVGHK
jgi:DHA3 family macrolide efflux protein-like MFS transporter